LVRWKYCTEDDAERLKRDSRSHAKGVQLLRDDLVRIRSREPDDRPLRDLRIREKAVEVDAKTTAVFETELAMLRERVDRALKPLQDDLARATSLAKNETIRGMSVLRHPDLLLATRLEAIHELFPADALVTLDKRLLSFDEALLDKARTSLLVVGPAGYGKTSFCRWNALKDAERFHRDSSAHVPVYIPLHELSAIPKSFEKAFLGHVGHSALLPEGILKKFIEG
jgi:hypothetical protein